MKSDVVIGAEAGMFTVVAVGGGGGGQFDATFFCLEIKDTPLDPRNKLKNILRMKGPRGIED